MSHGYSTKTPELASYSSQRWSPASSTTSSNKATVSAGLAIQAVVQASRAWRTGQPNGQPPATLDRRLTLKSFAPTERNWSPTWSDLFPAMPPKYFWQVSTPHDLSPTSIKTSLPPGELSVERAVMTGHSPLNAQNGNLFPSGESSYDNISP